MDYIIPWKTNYENYLATWKLVMATDKAECICKQWLQLCIKLSINVWGQHIEVTWYHCGNGKTVDFVFFGIVNIQLYDQHCGY